MPQRDEATFVLHGLDADSRVVRANVFVQKLKILLRALHLADKEANRKPGFIYMLSKLESGSAAVTVREKQKARKRPLHSGISYLEMAASAIYNGDRSTARLPLALVQQVQKLGEGVAKKFSHAELAFSDDNIIRIDDYLLKQSEDAIELTLNVPPEPIDKFYRGLAIGAFDGTLKEIDARGTMLRGKLILTAGGLEIDCVMNKDRIPQARESFDQRVVVEGAAHYDGESQLPDRIDIRAIRIINGRSDLARWRGAFEVPPQEVDEEDW
jgi:hypothetical protein